MSPAPEFSSEIVAVLSATAGGERSKTYRQRGKITLQQKSASCFSAGCAQNRLWIFSGKWDKYGTFCPKMACFLQFYIVATTQNQSIGFIVGNSSTSRIDALSVSSMTRRSTPKPRPPVGGRPYSRALT